MGITIGEFLQIFIDVVMAIIDILGIDLGDIDLGDNFEIHAPGQFAKLFAHSSCRTDNCNFHDLTVLYSQPLVTSSLRSGLRGNP